MLPCIAHSPVNFAARLDEDVEHSRLQSRQVIAVRKRKEDRSRGAPPAHDKEVGWASDDPRIQARRLFAEAWGTFLLVLVACAVAMQSKTDPQHVSSAAAAVAPGLIVMVVIYVAGGVSGAHINPVVTLGFALRRNFPWRRVPGYMLVQLLGAILAATLLRALFGPACHYGDTTPGPGISAGAALVLEMVLTTGLVNTILATASGGRNIGPNAAIAVGGYIALAGLWAGSLTGASMNPARSLAPALVCGDSSSAWIYIAGPILGAAIAVIFEWILKGPPTREGTKTAQGRETS